jgi:hypothetical protein
MELPERSRPKQAINKGTRQNQQKSLRQRGTAPAIGKGTHCRSAERAASAQRRGGTDFIEFESSIGNVSGYGKAAEDDIYKLLSMC